MHRLLLTLIGLLLASGCTAQVGWKAVDAAVTAAFPDVETISTDSLARLLADSSATAPVLLDVRTEDEYAVSRLSGAIRVDPDLEDFATLDSLKGRPLVLYCSVGYRSAEMTSRLMEAGFPNVANLRGSIFRWANEGRPVFRDGRSVHEVHPYDGIWGRLLNEELRAD